MKYFLLLIALVSFNAIAHTEYAIRSPEARSSRADGCPDGYATDDGKPTSDCKREVKCTRNMGVGEISQLERGKNGQVFLHRYTVDFICQPDGNFKRVVKKLD